MRAITRRYVVFKSDFLFLKRDDTESICWMHEPEDEGETQLVGRTTT